MAPLQLDHCFIVWSVVTWIFRIETTGVDLDHIGEAAGEPAVSKAIA